MPKTPKSSITETNERLKSALIGYKIVARGEKLSLVGTLPPKPLSGKTKPFQQRIALGLPNNSTGIKAAELEAYRIFSLVSQGQDIWKEKSTESKAPLTIAKEIERFKKEYFNIRKEDEKSLTTWTLDYLKPLQKLPQNSQPSEDVVKKVLLQTFPDTRTRKRYCLAFSKFLDFLEIKHTLGKYKGSYSPKKHRPIDIPTDTEIVEARNLFSNPEWQLVYSLQACYGLRNHECFHLDLSKFPIAYVSRGKTGERYVFPYFLDWAKDWIDPTAKLPSLTVANNSELGHRVSVAYKRAGVKFSPYSLRHAYAIRTLKQGLELSYASIYMGHSIQVHSTIYHSWISEADVIAQSYKLLEKGRLEA